MKRETAGQLTEMMSKRGRGGHRHGGRARGHQGGRQDGHRRGGRATAITQAVVHRLRARSTTRKMAIAVTVERTRARAARMAAPIAKQVLEALLGDGGAMTEVADNTLVDGRYRILRRIGSGGMADVYCAEDTHLGREVALKVLHRRFAQDQEFVERFRREAKAAAGLQHPNVVGVFDRGEHEGTYYIAMEHLHGRTLKEIVDRARRRWPRSA